MKTVLNFDLNGIDSLPDLIRTGLKGYATNTAELGGMTTFWCLLGTGAVLKIYSMMTDISDWDEVGILVFRTAAKDENVPKMISLTPAWECISSLEKLVIDEINFSAASGLVIENCDGEKLTVLCGAKVYSIQITSPFFLSESKPEYELSRYSRCSL